MFRPVEKALIAWCRFRRWQSAKTRPFSLSAEGILEGIDPMGLDEIRSRHAMPDPGIRVEKYLEMEKWLEINVRRLQYTGLDLEKRKLRMLDLGSGAGYFLHIAKRLGHDVLGFDLAHPAWFGRMTKLLGVPRSIQRIAPFTPLRHCGERFDCVTGFMICFNDHFSDRPWGVEEWRFFLDDLWTHLRPGALVWLEMNPCKDGAYYTPELKRFFESRGALVDRKRVIWGMSKARYLALKHLDETRLQRDRPAHAGQASGWNPGALGPGAGVPAPGL